MVGGQSTTLFLAFSDMEAANAAGMKGIIAQYGYIDPKASLDTWQATGSVQSPLELLRYIET